MCPTIAFKQLKPLKLSLFINSNCIKKKENLITLKNKLNVNYLTVKLELKLDSKTPKIILFDMKLFLKTDEFSLFMNNCNSSSFKY